MAKGNRSSVNTSPIKTGGLDLPECLSIKFGIKTSTITNHMKKSSSPSEGLSSLPRASCCKLLTYRSHSSAMGTHIARSVLLLTPPSHLNWPGVEISIAILFASIMETPSSLSGDRTSYDTKSYSASRLIPITITFIKYHSRTLQPPFPSSQ